MSTEHEKPESLTSTRVEDESRASPTEAEFEPIRSEKAEAKPGSSGRPGSLKEQLSRTRSQNGYGCDGEDEDEDIERASAGKDPWEVEWSGGDKDPMNPRSINHGKKWAIVLIISMASLCA